MLETHLIDTDKISKLYSIELHGHRSDIRSVTLSSDNDLLLSTSHNAVKIWNPSTGVCLRTIESGYGLCSSFVPGNRYALVGTKSGALEILDVGSGGSIEVIEAHAGSIRSIVPIPDENGSVSSCGFVTGSADHDVKFWEYRLLQKPVNDSKQLTVTNVRTLKMNDDVLAVCISPDSKHLAVSLLDCTIKVFFVDSLKFFLSLYGHKLPVLCMDISSDGDLIVSGSADKNLKIWGLDFGDCHKSIFAHADSVMDVKFCGERSPHKYWDADKFELLLTLEGHHAEVWCLAVSNRGDFIVTGSHDRSIRRWDRTEEPFFIEEEREKRLEEIFESDLDNLNEDRYAPKELVPDEGSVGVPGKKTKETLSATDLVIDALDMVDAEIKRIDQHKEDQKNGRGGEFQSNIMMRGLSPSDYVLHTLANVNTNDLEQTLLSLPFSDALKLMSYLKEWVLVPDKGHHVAARPVLIVLKDILHERVKECKDTIGFNLAAMDHLKELMSMRSDAPFCDAKAKLMEIRQWQSKRAERGDTNEKPRKKPAK
ncbi:Dip2/Utp12 Family [Musa troglodytarum]|uniref:Dip2/Utp12 Family n=1 Tax=Musa troglodytarum TaxID=320322 RepID=A0A9E7EVU8_9LILI|nr:Dip2/Utp12 Family [Musa troglodytarum]